VRTMGKYETGYARQDRDFYPTPAWPIEALAEQVELRGKRVLECACGDGRMARALEAAGACVTAFDIADYGYGRVRNFLSDEFPEPFDGTITNPPYGPRGKTAEAFIETGIRRLGNGFLALLLPADFDSAVTRRRFFDECRVFAAKIILTRRVKWFQNPDNPKVTPKENSAWFLWAGAVLCVRRPPIIIYAPRPKSPSSQIPQSPITDFFGGKQRSRTDSQLRHPSEPTRSRVPADG
jgi:SAM-dependent methyltransferase